ncbi:hypothetical protein DFJ74DRAFT_606802 [Hyaloraphidium curvatum]|nr:hypothetical protein DFJ74DRAFT_606802 [Hyaloraphidium curvatum]
MLFYGPLFLFGLISLISYMISAAYYWLFCRTERDLKKAYNAEWALVTGGSSGIGLSMAKRLAKQGINVVVAALDDKHLASATEQLRKEFPGVEVRSVGVDLGKEGREYMDRIEEACKGIEVQLVFSNAGFVKPGLFSLLPYEVLFANHTTNITSHLAVVHHFTKKMIAARRRGLVVFTSSSASFLPNPLASMYASTKAYMSTFAGSIAAELRPFGIDVTVVHPSPVASNFYENAKGFSLLEAPKASAQSPDELVSTVFRAAGKLVVLDEGAVTVGMRLGLKMADWNLVTEAMARVGGLLPDYVKFRKAGLEANGIPDVKGQWWIDEAKKAK